MGFLNLHTQYRLELQLLVKMGKPQLFNRFPLKEGFTFWGAEPIDFVISCWAQAKPIAHMNIRCFAITDPNTQRPGSSEMISEEHLLLLLPPWRPGDVPVHGQHSAECFYFRSQLLELAGALDQLTYCLARIRAWMRASWLWPSPDKPKVVLTGWEERELGELLLSMTIACFFLFRFPHPETLVYGFCLSINYKRNERWSVFVGLLFWTRRWSPFFWTWVFASHLESGFQKLYQEQCRLSPAQAKAGFGVQLPLPTVAAALTLCTATERRCKVGSGVLEMWVSTGQIPHPQAGWQSQGIPDSAYLSSLEE